MDLAQNVFALHGVDAAGHATLVRPKITRDQLLPIIAQLPPCLIGMEACSGAHHWARLFRAYGHTVRLMAPKFVAPYRMSGKRGKNDAADAAAICEAVSRPAMRFVPVKDAHQQAMLCLHRTRQGFVTERTALYNRIRGLIAEFGIVLPQKVERLRHHIGAHLEDLPGWANRCIGDLLAHADRLDERIAEYDRAIADAARQDERSKRLMQLPGIGPTTASALLATLGVGHEFDNGRQLAAWLGLTPGQYSSGGKVRLGRITKAGDAYLRGLLVMGARAVLAGLGDKQDRSSHWARSLQERRGYWKAVVAIAAKNARRVWAVLKFGDDFRLAPA
ncbi:IS110 family transposase [Crenobacter cavernae]|uniref:IS110 family transposase n=1 Tax=Crenobacter cavernae TaxID=2290923 RepID=A0A345Y4W7_9NEIS|nr:IS110 family transposase [Crenobacter cavernae]AXK38969.1 IS110 family transposase [Crenobacter cavernae]